MPKLVNVYTDRRNNMHSYTLAQARGENPFGRLGKGGRRSGEGMLVAMIGQVVVSVSGKVISYRNHSIAIPFHADK